MSSNNLFELAQGKGSVETLPSLGVSNYSNGVYKPHENIYVENATINKEGLLNIRFVQKHFDERTNKFRTLAAQNIILFNNFNSEKLDGNNTVPCTPDDIMEQIVKTQSRLVHILGCFHDKSDIVINSFKDLDIQTLTTEVAEGKTQALIANFDKIYSNISEQFVELLSKADKNIPLKLKFVRSSRKSNFPTLPFSLIYYTDKVTGERKDIFTPFIAPLDNITICNKIKYSDFELGVSGNGFNKASSEKFKEQSDSNTQGAFNNEFGGSNASGGNSNPFGNNPFSK